MKRLTITYGDAVLCDTDQVAQVQFSESDDAVSLSASFRRPVPARKTATGGRGMLDMLTTAASGRPPAGRRTEPQPDTNGAAAVTGEDV